MKSVGVSGRGCADVDDDEDNEGDEVEHEDEAEYHQGDDVESQDEIEMKSKMSRGRRHEGDRRDPSGRGWWRAR